MSGLEVIAAVLGITDVALRSISTTYNTVKAVKDAPTTIAKLSRETGAVIHILPGLEGLQDASGETQEMVRRVGVAEAVNECGKSCASLNEDLVKWTKSGDSLVAKLRFVSRKAQVERCCADMHTAKGTVVLAVSMATLALLSNTSSAAEIENRNLLKSEIATLQGEAQKQQADAKKVIDDLQARLMRDDNDFDAERALDHVKKQIEACERLCASCLTAQEAMTRLTKVKLTVGHTTADMRSKNNVNVPKEVLDKLEYVKLKVGDMKATNDSFNNIGIF
ncbi:hypothetical protein LTR56_018479 [Elasticomyces elasticus]|nr:hypothetical protein LTR56_018479 [Elasticomyces elasticus]KAK3632669.1 hypothetical protein LTR22_020483 [Elasticomyces elasticus]KAK4912209.1 hypothetical protein LTR49_019305 [Elasticomyces elasticus]KAK5769346.1 hypothetical protein LTS12_000273 [Elasticomyces elasticus]